MSVEVGRIEALYRYPVKSMRGQAVQTATLGWHGIERDRRLALRRLGARGDFPWLCGSMLPALTQYTPVRKDGREGPPTHIRTPDGKELALFGDALAADIERRYQSPVEMTQVKHGVFDEATLSVIATATVSRVCKLADQRADVRRFRPNLLIRATHGLPFEEDAWVGGVLTFGDGPNAPAVAIIRRDLRCVMVNIDPDGATMQPKVMKACARANDNHAGVYCTPLRVGRIAVGQSVVLHRAP